MQTAVAPGCRGSGRLGTVSGSATDQLCDDAQFCPLPGLHILFCKMNREPHHVGRHFSLWDVLGGVGPGGAVLLWGLELFLNHPLCLPCVTGPGGHAWAARVSGEYPSGRLPSGPRGHAHSVSYAWNAALHPHDQALVPRCPCSPSSLSPTWNGPPLCSVPYGFTCTSAVALFCL